MFKRNIVWLFVPDRVVPETADLLDFSSTTVFKELQRMV